MVLTKAGSILGPIATVLGYVMDILFRFTSSFGVFNVGLCIILFTIVMKTLMIPLTIKQQKTTKLMSVMNPEIQAIQKKYKGKSDQESMQRQNVEIQAVYEKYGTSMTGGCLPLLIQMPILLALYRVIYNIPAYVPSVRVYFDNVVTPLMGQADYAQKLQEITNIATACGGKLDKFDFTNANRLVDMLYKFSTSQWGELQALFPAISDVIGQNAAVVERMNTFLAADLMSQAEHDMRASAILLTTSESLAKSTLREIDRQIKTLVRQEIIQKSFDDYGEIIVCDNLRQALDFANELAPEHLELCVAEPLKYIGMVDNAGSVFLGNWSPEPLGDYYAGPNHVLPTSGTARFFSPLSVDSFVKKSSFIYYTPDELKKAKDDIMLLAETEGLTAHANSIKVRFE